MIRAFITTFLGLLLSAPGFSAETIEFLPCDAIVNVDDFVNWQNVLESASVLINEKLNEFESDLKEPDAAASISLIQGIGYSLGVEFLTEEMARASARVGVLDSAMPIGGRSRRTLTVRIISGNALQSFVDFLTHENGKSVAKFFQALRITRLKLAVNAPSGLGLMTLDIGSRSSGRDTYFYLNGQERSSYFANSSLLKNYIFVFSTGVSGQWASGFSRYNVMGEYIHRKIGVDIQKLVPIRREIVDYINAELCELLGLNFDPFDLTHGYLHARNNSDPSQRQMALRAASRIVTALKKLHQRNYVYVDFSLRGTRSADGLELPTGWMPWDQYQRSWEKQKIFSPDMTGRYFEIDGIAVSGVLGEAVRVSKKLDE